MRAEYVVCRFQCPGAPASVSFGVGFVNMAEVRHIVSVRRSGGFTLIELLVLVAVLAILAEFLFRTHARPVPYLEVAVGIWLVLTCALPALVRRWLFAYLLGVVATAGLLSYCMLYRGF